MTWRRLRLEGGSRPRGALDLHYSAVHTTATYCWLRPGLQRIVIDNIMLQTLDHFLRCLPIDLNVWN